MNQSKPSAEIIADSISREGVRLTSIQVTLHRYVLAELNTHRMFSRNSASSRAIPIEKQINKVNFDLAYPLHWGLNQSGMQADQALSSSIEPLATDEWRRASINAIVSATMLTGLRLHKQVVNRLLEPFLWHTVLITATEWDNFFHQRCHPDAQPEMKAAADAIQLTYFQSVPLTVNYGAWHLPYVDDKDWDTIYENSPVSPVEIARKISVARCARVSYENQDGHRSINSDLELYERLTEGGHWSPFEHIATPMTPDHHASSSDVTTEFSGNFRGWHQFRKVFGNENRTRFIPNLPILADEARKLLAKYEQIDFEKRTEDSK